MNMNAIRDTFRRVEILKSFEAVFSGTYNDSISGTRPGHVVVRHNFDALSEKHFTNAELIEITGELDAAFAQIFRRRADLQLNRINELTAPK